MASVCSKCKQPIPEEVVTITITTFLGGEGTVVCKPCYDIYGSFGSLPREDVKRMLLRATDLL